MTFQLKLESRAALSWCGNVILLILIRTISNFPGHVNSEMDFSKALNKLGETAILRDDSEDYGSNDIGAAFQRFSVVTKELSNLMKNLVSWLGEKLWAVLLDLR